MFRRMSIIPLIILFSAMIVLGMTLMKRREPKQSDELTANVKLNISSINKQWSIGLSYDKNHNSDTWYMYVPSMIDPANEKISFKGCSSLKIEDIDGNVLEYKNEDKFAGLTEGETYYLHFCNKDEILETVKFMYLRSEGVAAAFITTDSGSMDYINENKNNYEKGNILILDKDGSVNYLGALKKISGRGNTSWEKDKKPYALKLAHNAELLGMNEAMNWVLLSNYYDISFIRNKVTKYLGKKLGFSYNTESQYIDLYCNGVYFGLYELCEKVEVESTRLNITDLEEENTLVNVKQPIEYDTVSVNKGEPGERVGYDLPWSPKDITGGYLIEKNYSNRYTRFPSRFRTDAGEKYVIRSPRHASMEEVDYIAGVMQKIEDGAEAGEDISEYADVKSFADKYLLEEFVANEASGATSSFFYKDSDKIDSKVYAGPAWDYDKCLGNAMKDFIDDTEHLNFLTAHTQGTRLFYNLYKNSESYRKLVSSEYKNVLRPAILKVLSIKIPEYAEVPESDEMDPMNWTFTLDSVKETRAVVEEFIKDRMAFFDRVFIDNEELAYIHFEADETIELAVIKGSEIGALPTVGDVKNWVNKDTGEKISETTIVNGDITAVPAE
ncbi:MAG: CotH kinase family protein [Lachnospiraceae bacterium]|nr:CotH kinase family protein [Lachnospiraceae bacterium]